MRKQLNCPNCGGPITSEQCEYCGTMFYDFSAIEIGKPCYLKIKHENNIILVQAIPKDVDLQISSETCDVVDISGRNICSFVTRRNMDLSMDFDCIPFEDDHLMEVRVI